MEHQAQVQINRILDRVHSLNDLSADNIIELRRISEHSLILDKFKVSSAEYWNWLDKVGDDIRGVECDAQNACIVLKGCPGWMYEAVIDVIRRRLFSELEDRLSTATSLNYVSISSKSEYNLEMIYYLSSQNTNLVLECILNNEFSSSSKEADACFKNLKLNDQW